MKFDLAQARFCSAFMVGLIFIPVFLTRHHWWRRYRTYGGLIRLHQKATAPLHTDERETRVWGLLDEKETWVRYSASDPPMIRKAGRRSKRIQV